MITFVINSHTALKHIQNPFFRRHQNPSLKYPMTFSVIYLSVSGGGEDREPDNWSDWMIFPLFKSRLRKLRQNAVPVTMTH